jgi:hypothetical protein
VTLDNKLNIIVTTTISLITCNTVGWVCPTEQNLNMEDCNGDKDSVVDGDKKVYDIEQFDILKTVGKGEEVEHNK